ncbi:PAS domain-containing protein [Kamptonema cortianum]|nr:PAS domain-containing protein [Oscillatoria laete-virens]MDK3161840.1 PAS domain-containing protein [Kamptonema cortianum]MDL5054410.1 PAS domain-containing protein [Oscillatoria laete-virens NRMC-F 0139]
MKSTRRKAFKLDELSRDFFDSLPGNAAVISSEGKILAVNQAWREFADQNGLRMENYGVGSDYLISGSDSTGKFSRHIRQVIAGKKPAYSCSYECPTPEAIYWFEMNVRPLPHQKGCFLVIHRNVSERRERHRKIVANQNLIRSVSGLIPGAVVQFRIDESGEEKLLHSGEELTLMRGGRSHSRGEHIEKVSDLIAPEERAGFFDLLEKSADLLRPVNAEYQIAGAIGVSKWMNIRINPARDEKGGVLWEGVILDVTEDRILKTKLEIERQRRLSNLESLLSLLQISRMNFLDSLHLILREANRFLFSYRSSVWLTDDEGKTISRIACVDDDGDELPPGQKIQLPCSSTILEEQFIYPGKNKPVNSKDRILLSDMFKDLGDGSVLCSPIYHDGKFKGVITHKIQSQARHWDEIDREYSLALAQAVQSSYDRASQYSIQMSLVHSEAKNRAILNALPDNLVLVSRFGVCQDIRKQDSFLSGYSKEEIQGENFFSFLPVNVASNLSYLLEKAFGAGNLQTAYFAIAEQDEIRHLEARISALSKDEAVILIRDQTEIKHLENQVIEIAREERTRIGADMHDGLGQEMTALSFLCSSLMMGGKSLVKEDTEKLEQIHKHIQRCIDQTRLMARGLSPFQLEGRGLISVLRGFLRDYGQAFQIETSLESPNGFEIHNPSVSEHIFRIVQEAAHNAIRHGKSKKVSVKINPHQEGVVIGIISDGLKFDMIKKGKKGMGMKVMKYRADLIGAAFDIQPLANGGLEIVCSVPTGALTDPHAPRHQNSQ